MVLARWRLLSAMIAEYRTTPATDALAPLRPLHQLVATGAELPVLLGEILEHLVLATTQTGMMLSPALSTGDARADRASRSVLGDAVRWYESGAGAV